MSDLQTSTVNDVKAWYKTWYAPNNATLVIAGDVNPDEVFALAKRYYGPITGDAYCLLAAQFSEPVQVGIKRVVVKAPAELPRLVMAYHTPVLRDPEQDWQPYALQMLAGVLDGNESARLNKDLVRDQQVASNVGADYDALSRGPSLFTLEATPSTGKTVQDVGGRIARRDRTAGQGRRERG